MAKVSLTRALLITLATAVVSGTLAGCYVPSRTTTPERALSIYRGSKDRRAAVDRRGSSAPRTLSIEQVVEMAKQSSAHLAAMNARAETAAARVEEEGQWNNPELRVSQVQLDEFLRSQPRAGLALRFSPDRPGELDAKVAIARAEESAARAEAHVEEQIVEAEARWMFESVLLFDAEIEAANKEAAAQKGLADLVKTRAERGAATRVDEAFGELASSEAAEDSRELQADRAIILGALLDHIGLSATAEVRLVGAPPDPASLPELPGEEALIETALRARPELEVAAARMDAADASAHIERSKRWPWLSFVQLGYDFEPGIRQGLGWTFGAGVELPLFSVNSGGVLRADAERTEAKRAFRAEVARIAREVRDRLREARAARDLVHAFKKSVLPAADLAMADVKTALDAGQVDLLRMAMVEERSRAARRQKLKLLRRYHEAMAALRAAAGGRGPEAQAARPITEKP